MFYHLEQTTSTNDDARDPKYRHGDVISAEYQTAGRGQRGHKWLSAAGRNLMFSLVLEPRHIPALRQFMISEAVPLGIADTLAEYGIDARIKWTNDIYVGDKKITGMLIEHSLADGHLARTIAGIGVNVNQTEFDPALPNPTSMRLLTGREYDRQALLVRLHDNIMERYKMTGSGHQTQLHADYKRVLYRIDEPHTFRLPDGTAFTGIIRDVEADGALVVEHPDGIRRNYLFRQIEFVI